MFICLCLTDHGRSFQKKDVLQKQGHYKRKYNFFTSGVKHVERFYYMQSQNVPETLPFLSLSVYLDLHRCHRDCFINLFLEYILVVCSLDFLTSLSFFIWFPSADFGSIVRRMGIRLWLWSGIYWWIERKQKENKRALSIKWWK